jgi:hypothetical protein
VSSRIDSICKEMPGMADCSTCPDPDRSTGISNCPILTTYSKLCLDMPNMAQCSEWKRFCTSTSGLGPLCDAKTPFPTTGTTTSTTPSAGTSAPSKKSLAVGGPSLSMTVVVALSTFLLALSAL